MKTYFVLLLMTIVSYANGQITTPQLLELNNQITKNHPENYQIGVQEFNKLSADSMDNRTRSLFYQLLSFHYSAIGDYDQLLFNWDQQYVPWIKENKIECDTSFYIQHQFVDAKKYILEQSKNEQVVMINEAHNTPYHRAFVMQLLKEFRQLGFKYLAIEDLSDQNINTHQQIADTAGFYSREPLFAEMIREALRHDFTLVKYEAVENTSSNRMRDSLQAVNLVKILKNDPDAKLLVYAGYDHIQEGTQNNWKKMAQFFTEMIHINPLTISQTRHIEHYYPEFETGEFRAANQFGSFNEPVIAVKNDTAWHDKFVDISIIHPRYLNSGKRPDYLNIGGLRKAIPLHTKKEEKGLFVQAYYANEKTGHRIPADQVPINNEQEFLYLRPGKYVLEFKNSNNKVIKIEKIDID